MNFGAVMTKMSFRAVMTKNNLFLSKNSVVSDFIYSYMAIDVKCSLLGVMFFKTVSFHFVKTRTPFFINVLLPKMKFLKAEFFLVCNIKP